MVVFVMNFTPAGEVVKNTAYSFSKPIQISLWKLGAAVTQSLKRFCNTGNRTGKHALKKMNEELQARNLMLEALEKENETLKEALNLELEKNSISKRDYYRQKY